MQEAGMSLTVKMFDKHGMSNLVTFRAEKAEGWESVMKARGEFITKALEHGWTPCIEGQRGPQVTPNAPQSATPAANGAPADGDHVFTATTLTIEFNSKGEKTGKLKGKPFEKFGVRLWPEMASALGFNLDEYKPGDYPIAEPIQVRYAVNDEGKPSKIIGRAA